MIHSNVKEIVSLAMRHANMLSEWKGEDRAVLEMRKAFSWYIKGIRARRTKAEA